MLATAFVPALTQEAGATFPGHNGKIVFASDRCHFFDIYAVLPYGHDVHRVTNDTFLQLGPVWSPNGSRIAHAQCCNNGNFDIYAINANGSGARRLTNNHGQDIDPSYSRKGKIAYASEHSGNYDIWVMNGDGSHKHRITHDNSDELEPAWNPGGTKIAIQSTKTGHGDIYTMSPTGHGVKRITSNDGVDKEPTWSPAGKSASQRYGKRTRSSSSFPRTAAARAGSSPTERETTRIRRGRPTAIGSRSSAPRRRARRRHLHDRRAGREPPEGRRVGEDLRRQAGLGAEVTRRPMGRASSAAAAGTSP